MSTENQNLESENESTQEEETLDDYLFTSGATFIANFDTNRHPVICVYLSI